MPQSFLCFSVVPAGTVKTHYFSLQAFIFFLFSNIVVTIHCYQSMLTLTVIGRTIHLHLEATCVALHVRRMSQPAHQQAQLYQATCFKVSFSSTARQWLLVLFYRSAHPYFEEQHDSLQNQCRAETQQTYTHFGAWLVPHPSIHPFTPLSPAEATSTATIGSRSSSISSRPTAHGSKGLEQRGGWGEGNGDNASFSSPVFGFIHSRCASTIVQGSKCSSTVQKFQEFDSLCIYYIYVSLQSHRSTMNALKRSLNTTLVRYYLFSPFQCMYWEHSGEIRKYFHCSPTARQPCQPPLNSRFTNSVQWLSGWKCWEKNNFIYG